MNIRKLLVSLLVVLAGGLFAAGGVSCSGCGNNTPTAVNATDTLRKAILRIAEENTDGFTVDTRTLKPVAKGFAVSLEATQNSFGEEGLARVIDYVTSHPEADAYGGWLDTCDNKYYFDATVICDTKEEAEKLARENHQKAYFDLETKKETRL